MEASPAKLDEHRASPGPAEQGLELTVLPNGDVVLREEPRLLLRTSDTLYIIVGRSDREALTRSYEWDLTQLVTERIKPLAFGSLKVNRTHPATQDGKMVLMASGGDLPAMAAVLKNCSLKYVFLKNSPLPFFALSLSLSHPSFLPVFFFSQRGHQFRMADVASLLEVTTDTADEDMAAQWEQAYAGAFYDAPVGANGDTLFVEGLPIRCFKVRSPAAIGFCARC